MHLFIAHVVEQNPFDLAGQRLIDIGQGARFDFDFEATMGGAGSGHGGGNRASKVDVVVFD